MEKEFTTLEFDKVLAALAEHAISPAAKELCLSLSPAETREDAEKALGQTASAEKLLLNFGAPSFGSLKDVTGACARAQNGAQLAPSELLAAANVLKLTERLKKFLDEHLDESDALSEDRYSLVPNNYLADKILSSFVGEDEVADGASPALREIRRKQAQARNKIKSSLDSLVRSQQTQKYLQENIVTQRNGRYVIPVKAEYRSEIAGLVHDTSSSGATLFIEPMSVVNANNELSELDAKERAEIDRILSALSSEVGDYAETISEDFRTARFFDFCFAKARYAAALRAVRPELNENGIIQAEKARHPLISKDRCVPIDIALGDKYSALIVTGPNTGGKTVSLKTTGLLCLMAKSGLFVPCRDEAKIGFFDRVFADIGDEQSIEQSLSTFSAHMANISSILTQITPNSLVLMDELGSGTDPVEGAALAIAIIEQMQATGARIMCTTHYAELKLYALQTPDVENASCEFDVATLKPTYRLIIGIPGKSNAFAIASMLGISEDTINNAKFHLDNESVKVERVLADLEISKKTAQFDIERAEHIRQKAADELKKAREEREKILADAEKDAQKSRQKALDMIESARREAQVVTDELDRLRKEKERSDFKKNIEATRAATEDRLDKLEEKIETRPKEKKKPLERPLKVGDSVRVYSMNKEGEVLEEPKNGKVMLQIGSVKMRFPLEDLEIIKPKQPKQQQTTLDIESRATRRAVSELDLRGVTVIEAELMVDEYIDECSLSGLKVVSVIHGKGTGALRAAVQQRLKRNKLVESYRLGTFGEGESGVTIVTLK
mgnify:FL=1